MANVLIRDLAEDVHERLKEQATTEGLSLQAYLARELASLAARMTPMEWAAFVEERLAVLGGDDPDRGSTLRALDESRAERDTARDRPGSGRST